MSHIRTRHQEYLLLEILKGSCDRTPDDTGGTGIVVIYDKRYQSDIWSDNLEKRKLRLQRVFVVMCSRVFFDEVTRRFQTLSEFFIDVHPTHWSDKRPA